MYLTYRKTWKISLNVKAYSPSKQTAIEMRGNSTWDEFQFVASENKPQDMHRWVQLNLNTKKSKSWLIPSFFGNQLHLICWTALIPNSPEDFYLVIKRDPPVYTTRTRNTSTKRKWHCIMRQNVSVNSGNGYALMLSLTSNTNKRHMCRTAEGSRPFFCCRTAWVLFADSWRRIQEADKTLVSSVSIVENQSQHKIHEVYQERGCVHAFHKSQQTIRMIRRIAQFEGITLIFLFELRGNDRALVRDGGSVFCQNAPFSAEKRISRWIHFWNGKKNFKLWTLTVLDFRCHGDINCCHAKRFFCK